MFIVMMMMMGATAFWSACLFACFFGACCVVWLIGERPCRTSSAWRCCGGGTYSSFLLLMQKRTSGETKPTRQFLVFEWFSFIFLLIANFRPTRDPCHFWNNVVGHIIRRFGVRRWTRQVTRHSRCREVSTSMYSCDDAMMYVREIPIVLFRIIFLSEIGISLMWDAHR
jgi:hypothetical protein